MEGGKIRHLDALNYLFSLNSLCLKYSFTDTKLASCVEIVSEINSRKQNPVFIRPVIITS